MFTNPGNAYGDRPPGWQILRIAGIPIYVEGGFLLFMGLIMLIHASAETFDPTAVGLLCFVIFISILVHELGHALASRLFGCDGIRIALVMFGGYATHTPTTRGRSLVISLAGPAFGLMLGFAAFLFYKFGGDLLFVGPPGAMIYLIETMIFINFFWTAFNLVPVHPLDGGRALFHGLSYGMREEKAMLWVARVSMALCVLLGAGAFQIGYTFVAFFFLMFFMDNWRMSQQLG